MNRGVLRSATVATASPQPTTRVRPLRWHRRWTIALSALAAAALPSLAEAATVAVTDVSGPTQEDVAQAIESTLRRAPGVQVFTRQDWLNASDDARLDPFRDQRALAQREGVDRLLTARIDRQGDRWTLVVEVFDPNGQRLKRWRARTSKIARMPELVDRLLLDRIGAALEGGGTADEIDPGPALRGARIRFGTLLVKGAERTERRLTRQLESYPQLERISSREIARTSQQLRASLDNADGRAQMGQSLGASGWLAFRSRGRGKRYSVVAKLYSGTDGQLIKQFRARGRSEREALDGMLQQVVALLSADPVPVSRTGPIASAPRRERTRSAPFVSSSESASSFEADVPEERTSTRSGRSQAPLWVALGVSLQSRDFSYEDDAFNALRPYELAGGAALAGELRWYPAGHFTDGWLTHLGAETRVRYLVGVSSEDSEGNQFGTDSVDVHGGVRGRLPLGSHEIGLAVGVGHHSFSVELPDDGPDLPNAGYTYLRAGADARFALPVDLQLYVGGAWRQVLSAGEIGDEDWFPNATQGGLDAHLSLGWAFISNLEVRLGAEYTRYFFSFNPEVGDLRVAGGALDQYIAGTLDVLWSL